MKKIFTAVLTASAAVFGCAAQSVVKIPVAQNPLFEVSTNRVNVSGADTSTGLVLGADLVVKGGSGHYSYRWYDKAGNELGDSPTLTVESDGVYNLDISDSCDCMQTVGFYINTTGIALATAVSSPLLTPNPSAGPVEISGFEAVQLTVVGMSGRMECIVDYGGAVIRHADLGNLPHGQYIVTLTDADGNTAVTRFLKK